MSRRKRIAIVSRLCRRGCGKRLATLNRPIHSSQADFDRYAGICANCLTAAERADMAGPLLMRTARLIVGSEL